MAGMVFEHVYADTGCELAPSCLRCPLPACRYDLPPKTALWLVQCVEYARARLQGCSVEEAAHRVGRTRRVGFRMEAAIREVWGTAWQRACLQARIRVRGK